MSEIEDILDPIFEDDEDPLWSIWIVLGGDS